MNEFSHCTECGADLFIHSAVCFDCQVKANIALNTLHLERKKSVMTHLKAKENQLRNRIHELEKSINVRPEVLAFAHEMEGKLKKHDQDRGIVGWKSSFIPDLLEALHNEVKELKTALNEGVPHKVVEEAADVANFAMMLADIAGNFSAVVETARALKNGE